MWSDLLTTLGALTLGGAVAVLLLAITFRFVRTRYAARWRCWIWVLLCLRLIIPYSFLSGIDQDRQAPIQLTVPSDTVVYEYTPPVRPDTEPEPANTPEPSATPSDKPSQALPEPGELVPVPGAKPTPEKVGISLSQIVALVWLAGMVFMAAWMLVVHLRFVRYVRRWSRTVGDGETLRLYKTVAAHLELKRRPDLRICPKLRAPMLAGVFRPALLLPEDGIESAAMTYVLIHELTHYQRRDIWLKTLALLANIVHWFNPLMWYMVRLMERDTELACDEAALRKIPNEEHAAYGRTILDAVERLKKTTS